MDHLSNPTCQTNCFQRLAGVFGQLNTSIPVNQAILVGQHSAFPSVTAIAVQPKIGLPGRLSDDQTRSCGAGSESLLTLSLRGRSTTLWLKLQTIHGSIHSSERTPAESGNLYATSQASNAASRANYSGGGVVPRFSFTNPTAVKVPRYYEWSLELQQALGWNSIFSIGYVGNRGTDEEISNQALNGFSTTPFADLPTSAPDPRFGF